MKKVVVFGAAGHTGKYITRKMQSMQDVELTAFVRDPAKFEGMDMAGTTIVQCSCTQPVQWPQKMCRINKKRRVWQTCLLYPAFCSCDF